MLHLREFVIHKITVSGTITETGSKNFIYHENMDCGLQGSGQFIDCHDFCLSRIQFLPVLQRNLPYQTHYIEEKVPVNKYFDQK